LRFRDSVGLCQSRYNGNARHYTLVGVPQFDEHGLWAYHDVRFSKWGSLTETIVVLVEHSSAGLTAQQLQELLHIENLKTPAISAS
jgi:hypothetical protein